MVFARLSLRRNTASGWTLSRCPDKKIQLIFWPAPCHSARTEDGGFGAMPLPRLRSFKGSGTWDGEGIGQLALLHQGHVKYPDRKCRVQVCFPSHLRTCPMAIALAPWPSWLCSREEKISTHHSTLASQCHMEDGLQSTSGSAHTLSW